MDVIMWKLYKQVRCGSEIPTQAADGDMLVVQMGKSEYLSMSLITSSQSPTQMSLARWLVRSPPVLMGAGGGGYGDCSGDGGGGGWRWRDQLEVSEWTLPGPSVGEVTDEGVVASCQPPFAWEKRRARRRDESGTITLITHGSSIAMQYWGVMNVSPKGTVYSMSSTCKAAIPSTTQCTVNHSLKLIWIVKKAKPLRANISKQNCHKGLLAWTK